MADQYRRATDHLLAAHADLCAAGLPEASAAMLLLRGAARLVAHQIGEAEAHRLTLLAAAELIDDEPPRH